MLVKLAFSNKNIIVNVGNSKPEVKDKKDLIHIIFKIMGVKKYKLRSKNPIIFPLKDERLI